MTWLGRKLRALARSREATSPQFNIESERAQSSLPSQAERWQKSPSGGLVFRDQARRLSVHDRSCGSLEHVWLPRLGGATCVEEINDCDACGLVFHTDGLGRVFDSCPQRWHWRCSCCRARLDGCGCAVVEDDTTGGGEDDEVCKEVGCSAGYCPGGFLCRAPEEARGD